ncbi:hypothetical protein PanWU01x14_094460 [Parasponia andersonii]|uniref:Uncharacterized protein n=1 Tax=Parasponia andersonii TaxID=3476 RepID=A0A2P5D5T4_PARAD|nr:hypothetical protein PanWU01x14_094460 [Parasponia andersonii]
MLAWLVAFGTELTQRVHEGSREEEASEEVEVGWVGRVKWSGYMVAWVGMEEKEQFRYRSEENSLALGNRCF